MAQNTIFSEFFYLWVNIKDRPISSPNFIKFYSDLYGAPVMKASESVTLVIAIYNKRSTLEKQSSTNKAELK